ncbi:MAG: Ni/Fe hydrogenase subunit alpha [Promethearchaeati archaeon SRVP18_Atabeyarchaeia-1]
MTSEQKTVQVDYVARVEGEALIDVKVDNGEIKELKLNIWEPPRFFEGFLVGCKYSDVPDIVSKICGICPVAHMITSCRAVENAMSFAPSQQTRRLRDLLAWSQNLSSHVLHVYFLAAPDFLGYDSAITMLPKYGDVVKRALKMKTVANELTTVVGGRAVAPPACVVGGFTRLPSEDALKRSREALKGIKQDAVETVKLVSQLKLPDFERETEFVAVRGEKEYAINEGYLCSSKGIKAPEREFRKYIAEVQAPHSNAKWSKVAGRDSFQVGALARVNLNQDQLSEDSKSAIEESGFKFPTTNSFAITAAQAIEIIQSIDACISIIDEILPLKEDKQSVTVAPGEGYAITEAPRGLLYHNYRINRKGYIEKADIVSPTAHNSLNMENDLKALVQKYIDLPTEKLTFLCEQLIRAYDPCFSCSVHSLKVKITKY